MLSGWWPATLEPVQKDVVVETSGPGSLLVKAPACVNHSSRTSPLEHFPCWDNAITSFFPAGGYHGGGGVLERGCSNERDQAPQFSTVARWVRSSELWIKLSGWYRRCWNRGEWLTALRFLVCTSVPHLHQPLVQRGLCGMGVGMCACPGAHTNERWGWGVCPCTPHKWEIGCVCVCPWAHRSERDCYNF